MVAAWAIVFPGGVALSDNHDRDRSEPPRVEEPGELAPGEVILKLKPGVPEEVAHTLAAQVQGQVSGRISEYRLYVIRFPFPPEKKAQEAQVHEAIRTLTAHPEVEAAYPNYRVRIPTPPGSPSPKKPPI